MCPDMSTCVEDFCEIFLNYGDDCRPYADAALRCLDERATPDEFACWYGGPAVVTTMDVTCWPEFATAAFDHHC
jgi:hypothetical protein